MFSASSDGRSVQYSPNGNWIAVADRREVVLYDAERGEFVRRITAPGADFAFSPNGRELATFTGQVYGDHTFKIWSIDAKSAETDLVDESAGFTEVHCAAWSPDEVHLLRGGWPGNVEVWNTRTQERELFVDADGQKQTATSLDGSDDGAGLRHNRADERGSFVRS